MQLPTAGHDKTNLALPRLPHGYIPRPRLLTYLKQAQDADLTVVSGPAGSGKTTLLSAWAREVEAHDKSRLVRWVNLEPDTTAATDLWSRLHGALIPGPMPTAPGPSALAAAFNQQDRSACILIDEGQSLDHAEVADLARFAALLHQVQIVLATRRSAHQNSPVTTQFRIAQLRGEELAFTIEELAELARVSKHPQPPTELYEVCGGHPLLSRALISHASESGEIDQYKAADSWARSLVDADDLEAAELVATLPATTGAVAVSITSRTDAPVLLESWASAGLGARRPDGAFEFHPVIANSMKRAAQSDLDATRRSMAQEIATESYTQDVRFAPVVLSMLAETGRTRKLWPHVAANLHALTAAPETLTSALDTVGTQAEVTDGTLVAIRVLAQESATATSPAAISSLDLQDRISAALDELRQRPPANTEEEDVLWGLATFVLLQAAQQYEAARQVALSWLELIKRLPPSARTKLSSTIHTGLLRLSSTFTLTTDMDQAIRALDLINPGNGTLYNHCRTQRAFIHAMQGDVVEADRLISAPAQEMPRPSDHRSTAWIARGAITRAAVLVEQGHPLAARAMLADLIPRLDDTNDWPYALIVLSRTYVPDDPATGFEQIDTILRRHTSRPVPPGLQDLLDSAVGDLALLAGDTNRARNLTETRTDQNIALHLTAARLALITNDPGVMIDLNRLVQQPRLWPRLRAQALFLMAIHLNRAGDTEEASQAVRRALAISHQCGIGLILGLLPLSELEQLAHSAGVSLPENAPPPNPLADPLSAVRLTGREQALLQRLATPSLLREIAESEFVSINTIRSQSGSLYRKLGVTSRRQAVSKAYRRGLIPPQ